MQWCQWTHHECDAVAIATAAAAVACSNFIRMANAREENKIIRRKQK